MVIVTNVNKDRTREIRAFPIPHFPLDDYISPEDIQGKRAYGGDNAEVEAAVEMRVRRYSPQTCDYPETSRMVAITQGIIYAPNATVVGNYYTDFGITRKEVAFDLSNASVDVLAKAQEVVDHIQENILDGDIAENFIALCSPEFFDALIAQAGVKEAYKFYSTQEPLRNGLREGRYKRFVHGDVTYL